MAGLWWQLSARLQRCWTAKSSLNIIFCSRIPVLSPAAGRGAALSPSAAAVPSPLVVRHRRANEALFCLRERRLRSSPSLPCSFGSEVGRGRNGTMLNWLLLRCAIKRRNLGGHGMQGDVQGVGTLFPPCLCGIGALLRDQRWLFRTCPGHISGCGWEKPLCLFRVGCSP